MTLLKTLTSRGCIQDCSDRDGLIKLIDAKKIVFYCGFDPTADSLHCGSMLPLILMRKLQQQGHTPLVILGTATGMIGDPSGKSEERVLLDADTVHKNASSIGKQIEKFLDFTGSNAAKLLLNHEWIEQVSLLQFLRDVGKHFSVNTMIAKDSVKARLNNREQGISYTEFTYMLLQAYDFYWLNKSHNCQLQVGGSDQWGNITGGLELIRRKQSTLSAFGLTFPLLTTASGTKFGKTEAGAIWLEGSKTSPYHFYQYWLNSADGDIEKFLNLFSFKSNQEIKDLISTHKSSPEQRSAQKELATELTKLLHGEKETSAAIDASSILFSKDLKSASSDTLLKTFHDVPSIELSPEQVSNGFGLVELLVQVNACKSNGEARRLIEAGGIYINDERNNDSKSKITANDFIDNQVLLIRSGKKNYYLAKLK